MKRMIVGVAVSMALACGGNSAAPANSVNGTIHGQSVQTQNGVSAAVAINSSGVQTNFAMIILSNDGNLCSDLAANKEPKNSQGVELLVSDWNSTNHTSSVPVAAGDYQVTDGTGAPPAKNAVVFYGQSDASCKSALGATGMSGVVHITSVNNGVFSGSFDIVVAETDANGATTSTTDHWTGTFNPSLCASLSASLSTNQSTPPTCY